MQLQHLVVTATVRFEEWSKLVELPWSQVAGVVLDEAEELRRQLQATAEYAHSLLAQAGQNEHATVTVPPSPSPEIFAVAVVAASMDAATCVISPVSSGLRSDPMLRRIAQGSCRATGRFMRAAANVFDDDVGLVPTPPLEGPTEWDVRPRLRLGGAVGADPRLREGAVEDDHKFGT